MNLFSLLFFTTCASTALIEVSGERLLEESPAIPFDIYCPAVFPGNGTECYNSLSCQYNEGMCQCVEKKHFVGMHALKSEEEERLWICEDYAKNNDDDGSSNNETSTEEEIQTIQEVDKNSSYLDKKETIEDDYMYCPDVFPGNGTECYNSLSCQYEEGMCQCNSFTVEKKHFVGMHALISEEEERLWICQDYTKNNDDDGSSNNETSTEEEIQTIYEVDTNSSHLDRNKTMEDDEILELADTNNETTVNDKDDEVIESIETAEEEEEEIVEVEADIIQTHSPTSNYKKEIHIGYSIDKIDSETETQTESEQEIEVETELETPPETESQSGKMNKDAANIAVIASAIVVPIFLALVMVVLYFLDRMSTKQQEKINKGINGDGVFNGPLPVEAIMEEGSLSASKSSYSAPTPPPESFSTSELPVDINPDNNIV